MNDTTNGTAKYAVGGVFAVELYGLIFDLRWWIGLLLGLMIADFWFGCSESKKKGMKIPKSRCIRRTLNKMCDYTAVMMVGFLFGGAILQPYGYGNQMTGAFCGIIIACVAESCSAMGHILFLKGCKWSWRKFFIALIKFRWNQLGTALEKATEDTNEESDKEKENGKL